MQHIHLPNCSSTQSYLIETIQPSDGESILISTSNQTNGVGRTGNKWDHFKNGLAYSFTLSPNLIPTLTPLEVGVHLVLFFKKYYNVALKLKWPNDLLTPEGKKCGGIITNMLTDQTLAVGIGINLGAIDQLSASYKTPIDSITQSTISEKAKKELPAQIYKYIQNNRLPSKSVISDWNKTSYHLNKQVHVISGKKTAKGKFVGVGKSGEAIIENNGTITSMFSGSLYFD